MTKGAKCPPAEEQRFGLRTMVERVYSRLKDEFGARFIRVRKPVELWRI